MNRPVRFVSPGTAGTAAKAMATLLGGMVISVRQCQWQFHIFCFQGFFVAIPWIHGRFGLDVFTAHAPATQDLGSSSQDSYIHSTKVMCRIFVDGFCTVVGCWFVQFRSFVWHGSFVFVGWGARCSVGVTDCCFVGDVVFTGSNLH